MGGTGGFGLRNRAKPPRTVGLGRQTGGRATRTPGFGRRTERRPGPGGFGRQAPSEASGRGGPSLRDRCGLHGSRASARTRRGKGPTAPADGPRDAQGTPGFDRRSPPRNGRRRLRPDPPPRRPASTASARDSPGGSRVWRLRPPEPSGALRDPGFGRRTRDVARDGRLRPDDPKEPGEPRPRPEVLERSRWIPPGLGLVETAAEPRDRTLRPTDPERRAGTEVSADVPCRTWTRRLRPTGPWGGAGNGAGFGRSPQAVRRNREASASESTCRPREPASASPRTRCPRPQASAGRPGIAKQGRSASAGPPRR